MKKIIALCLLAAAVFSVGYAEVKGRVFKDLTSKSMVNEGSYLPPQCYTITRGEKGEVYNPCYSCHTDSIEPNYTNDGVLQESYDFAEYLNTNRWQNLFRDKTEKVSVISDEEILKYVRKSNYIDNKGNIIPARVLKHVPAGWDYNKNGKWDGYTPDCYFSFDHEGFDRSPEGKYTGWRAFAYAPFLGTFWPTNGSTDDVIIRLAEVFRLDDKGRFDKEVYMVNLAVAEAMIMRSDAVIDPVDEKRYGADLNRNGVLDTADRVKYDWDPKAGVYMHFVGAAEKADVQAAAGLFPEGTEFLHSVRYIDITEDSIGISPRMKELRYAKKKKYKNYTVLQAIATEEMKETYDFPDRLGEYFGDVERGISNSQGWVYQAFIEDENGDLRPQTFEETVFCMGCHTNVGATSDSIYSFPRKFDGESFQGGWYHWTQKDLRGTPEPKAVYDKLGEKYEYTFYLENNKAGDEFRGNEEVIEKFFKPDGSLKPEMVSALHSDVSVLLYPSHERALMLNKAYRVIVQEQSFAYGRDANVKPVKNVHKILEQKDFETGIKETVNLADVY